MKPNLVILTHRYPFFFSEPFLESEIIILSKKFDHITIIPSEINDYKRQIPENIYINTEFSKGYKRKVKRSISTLFSKYFWNLLLKSKNKIKDFNLIFIFSSRVIAYSYYINKNRSIFSNCIVYSYWLNEAPLAFIEVNKNLNLNSTLVSRAHRYDIYEQGIDHIAYWPEREKLLNNIDKIFVISENGKAYLDRKYYCSEKTMVAKLGVFDSGVLSSSSKNNIINIISVSRIDHVKRVLFIFRSIEAFSTKFKELKICWTHFGEGPLFQELLKATSQSENNNLKIELKGSVPNTQIYEFYKYTSIDCFINLSYSEGIPVSIMEAQSFGIPIIATDVGGTSEIVTQQTGILLNSDVNIVQVVDAFEKIIDNKFDRNVIKSFWSKNYDAKTNYSFFADELIRLYDNNDISK